MIIRGLCQLINPAYLPARVSMRSSERLVALTKLHPRRMGTWRPALPPRGIYAGESDATSMSEFRVRGSPVFLHDAGALSLRRLDPRLLNGR